MAVEDPRDPAVVVCFLSDELHNRLDSYCRVNGETRASFAADAIALHLDELRWDGITVPPSSRTAARR